jgi:hypothetical protein
MRPLGRITNDPTKIANILRRGEIDQVSRDLKESRKGKKPESPSAARARPRTFAPTNLFASYDSPPRAPFRLNQENISPNLFRSGLFSDDSDDEDKRGGLRKRRSYKKKKTRTNKRKRSSRTKKGTRRRR